MNKPEKETTEYYDWLKAKEYVNAKLGRDIRDYAGMFPKNGPRNPDAPYQDFWHWMLDKAEISNGCIVTMARWWGDGAEAWQQEILSEFLAEFGEPDETGEVAATFWVWW